MGMVVASAALDQPDPQEYAAQVLAALGIGVRV